jgi:hypothetical protein
MSELSNINSIIREIQKISIDDLNDKCIKVKQPFVESVSISGSNTFGQNAVIVTNNGAFTPSTVGFTPNNWFNDRWYFRATTVACVIRVYYIDGDYNEGTLTLSCPINAYVQIPIAVRFVNKFEKIGGLSTGTTICLYEPSAVFTGGLNFTPHQLSGNRVFYGMYMIPKNKILKLTDIEYFRNLSASTLSLLAYNKVGGFRTVLSYIGINGIFTESNFTKLEFTEGQVLVWYNTNTTSTSNTINSNFELYNL